MVTTTTTKPRQGSRTARRETRAASKPVDILRLLKKDHDEVKKYFRDFENTEDDQKKQQLATAICEALTLHAELEEAIFYPAAREALADEDLLDEANVEHQSAKQLIHEIQSMKPGDNLYDAKVKVLGEYINHHVEEEESELFAECRDSDMDLKALGEQFQAAKESRSNGKPAKKTATAAAK
jgi:hemerythrin superfamily protein